MTLNARNNITPKSNPFLAQLTENLGASKTRRQPKEDKEVLEVETPVVEESTVVEAEETKEPKVVETTEVEAESEPVPDPADKAVGEELGTKAPVTIKSSTPKKEDPFKVEEPTTAEEPAKVKEEPVTTDLTEEEVKALTTEEEIKTTVVEEETEVLESPITPEEVAHLEHQKPSVVDSEAFSRLSQSSETENVNANESYAEMVESMVSQQCQVAGVKNLDLVSFGIRAQTLKFKNLSTIQFGIHKFLGAPFTVEEENMIIHRLGVYISNTPKDRVVIAAVKEVKNSSGMSLYSLLFNDGIAQRFADIFNYKVMINKHESDVSKLVMVVEK